MAPLWTQGDEVEFLDLLRFKIRWAHDHRMVVQFDWKDIAKSLSKRKFRSRHVRRQFDTLVAEYNTFCILKEDPETQFHADTLTVTAPEEFWDVSIVLNFYFFCFADNCFNLYIPY